MQRTIALVLVLGLAGCTCGGEEASAPPATSPPPASAPPPTSTAPTGMSPEAIASALHDARASVEAHDYATARTRFDALAADPSATPPIRCEAGWVAHLAGDDDAAARAIDGAIVAFTEGPRTPELARSLAMCFYNRGRVFEAQGAPLDAHEAYSRSYMIRDDDTVHARLEATPDHEGGDTGTLGGVPYDFSNDVLTGTSETDLEHALSAGWRGAVIVGHATVTRRAAIDLSGLDATRAILYAVHDDTGAGDGAVLALATANGFRLATLPPTETPPTMRVEAGVLRVEYETSETREWVYDGAWQPDTVCLAACAYRLATTMICRGSPITCSAVTTAVRPHDVEHTPLRCHAIPSGDPVDGAPTASPTASGAYELAVDVDATGSHLRTVSGTSPWSADATFDGVAMGAMGPTLCGDHNSCSDIASWRFGPGETAPAPQPWIPDSISSTPAATSSIDGITWVRGVTPPLALVSWPGADGSGDDREFYETRALLAPHRGQWRELDEWSAEDDGAALPTLGDAEHVDLVPGEPLELRMPVRRDGTCDTFVVCTMLDGAIACRETPSPDGCREGTSSAQFDGQGHVTFAADTPAAPRDLVAWIREGLPTDP